MAIELDSVGNVQALNFPWVAKVQPVVWLLMLEPIVNGLHMEQHISTSTFTSFVCCCTYVLVRLRLMPIWWALVV